MRLSVYQDEIARLYRFLIPPGARVLELGCGSGERLAALSPSYGLGIDKSAQHIGQATAKFADRPELVFKVGDPESFDWSRERPFDYIVAADLIASLRDVQQTFARLAPVCTPATRLILNFHSNLWRPVLTLATALGLRERIDAPNWLSMGDVRNLLYLAGFEVITSGGRVLLPIRLPVLAPLFNRILAKLPLLEILCLGWYVVARRFPETAAMSTSKPTVSILVPTRNERGNIEAVFTRCPQLGAWTELVFVDGHSTDGTVEEIERCRQLYRGQWQRVKLITQTGKGKGQAVRQGFEHCEGDILMILDSDLTMPPEELPKYYEALVTGKAEFVNGCRLVYAQEDQAMRFLNMVANHLFAQLFTWLLGQRVKDTLCGTKVLWRRDYLRIAKNRGYFGDFDPFGDFDLLFGAAKLNLKIIDLPVRYRARTYGEIKIDRWRDGLLLLRMCIIAYRRLKLS